MRPRPIRPTVLPASSQVTNWVRFLKPPSRVMRSMGTMSLAAASSRATVCSATALMLEKGAFTTRMPRRVAAATSMLSTPMPCLATAFRVGIPSITASVMRAERMRMALHPWAWAMMSASAVEVP